MFRPVILIVAIALAPGCLHQRRGPGFGTDRCPSGCEEEQPVVRVKAPPQKVVVEVPECAPGKETPSKESAELPGKPESAPRPKKESAEVGAPESAPTGRPESTLGTIAAVNQGLALANQISGFSRTTALTSSLGTVNPGSSGLGIGIKWIHVPIPCPRLFSINETPSVTVPLTEANLVHSGMAQQQAALLQAGMVGVGGRGITREELAALVEQEIAARNQAQSAPRRQQQPACPPADSEEKKQLEKKLSAAEAQIERLTKTLDALDKKLETPPAGGPPK